MTSWYCIVHVNFFCAIIEEISMVVVLDRVLSIGSCVLWPSGHA